MANKESNKKVKSFRPAPNKSIERTSNTKEYRLQSKCVFLTIEKTRIKTHSIGWS